MPTLPWTNGRAVADPGSATVPDESAAVVMASRFELKAIGDAPAFLLAAMRIRRQMLHSPGNLGVSLIAKPLSRTFFTLSAWRDQADLDAAVPRQPHAQTMRRFHDRMSASQFVFWSSRPCDLPPAWPDALERLDAGNRDRNE
ncbi:putative quinol monooxygenase [Mycolicibacterium arenosum]|uniref:DUF3291 domain-containing protein n=1 Tax=Mycolicibacterium arenosum TaxID=2952157 RepID=A0ABT1MDI6_9MYCO|nr:DUF3291 domain-containing protein [Mycolicibacterium sp. CAU 1645]MCP9276952.1 DUF3291 domain-containing protein [Mycolicibacterium sp. CAU 1645]